MIVGKHVTLRPLELHDVPFTLKLRRDIEANKALLGFPFPVSLENETDWISNLYPQGERKTLYLAVVENQNNQFAGYLSVKHINYINGTAEFGIILLKEARGKGCAPEAMRLFFTYLYCEIHLRKITLYVLEDNAPAMRLYEKVGFSREGVLKDHVWQDGKYKNLLVMSIFLENAVKEFRE